MVKEGTWGDTFQSPAVSVSLSGVSAADHNYPFQTLSVWSVVQLCPVLCDPMDCSLSGSSVHGIPRQGFWSGLPFPSQEDLSNSGIQPGSPTLQIGVKLICSHVRQSQCACHEWLRALTDVKWLQYLHQSK